MQIHRSRPTRGFTVLPNAVLQDRRLSYTARGLLVDLLSRPDGWREDGRKMADTSPQGRHAVAKALRELTSFSYYLVERVRRADGTFSSHAHVYDVPRGAWTEPPSAEDPGPGPVAAGETGAHPVKDRGKEPTLPPELPATVTVTDAEAGGQEACASTAGEGEPESVPTFPEGSDPAMGEAAALLHRVTAQEPRLLLGAAEALALAPLVAPWLARGHGPRELAHALLGGLPGQIHSVSALLRDRLTRKLPPAVEPPAAPKAPRWHECTSCGRPTADEGTCRHCEDLDAPRPDTASEHTAAAIRGRALVRQLLAGGLTEAGPLAPAGA
ncbi:hypothetical protein [Streptomyces fuscigenes]|uniref:hypothetical protein n=1 Tax=Streptomyces fuscigenes TaxID=1528880 RepID=UPI001F4838BC|nr:hypothetical protein [Streptomyces fuscigenes]MCF3960417.1 hypothetical protein [Streptomyces fuscigenes]